MTNAQDRLRDYARLLDERIHVFEFQDGPHLSGVMVAAHHEKSRNPDWLTGLCYSVRDGKPVISEFVNYPFDDPDAFDPVALARTLEATGSRNFATREPIEVWLAGRMPDHVGTILPMPDPFEAIGWGMPWRGDWFMIHARSGLQAARHHLGLACPSSRGVPYPELAYPLASRLGDGRVGSARASFQASLPPACRDAMSFMRETLPGYDPRVLDALLDDPEGGVRAFALRHPLLAMRSLADPEVAGVARAGDLRMALDLSRRPELVGAWILRYRDRHPKSADRVDGTRRGHHVDLAVGLFDKIPREHLPTSTGEFAACVDVCNWVYEAAWFSGAELDEGVARELLDRAKGRWSHVAAQVRRIAPDLAGLGSPQLVGAIAQDMSRSFRWDLFCPAVHVAEGAEGLRDVQVGFRDERRRGMDHAISVKGMGLPDLVRMQQSYAKARPAIAAADTMHDFGLEVVGALPEMPWLDLGFVDVKPVRVRALEVSRGIAPRAETPGYITEWVALPAPAPSGIVFVEVLVARKDGQPTTHYEFGAHPDRTLPGGGCRCPGHDAIIQVLGSTVAEVDEAGIGLAMARMAGIDGDLPGLVEMSRSLHEARLADMIKAWRDILPRRFRGMDAKGFAACLSTERAQGIESLARG